MTEFNIGLYGKYPIDLGGMTLFPILGADIKLTLAQDTTYDGEKTSYQVYDEDEQKMKDGDTFADFSSVWFKLGVGIDIPLGDQLYLRPIFLYGLGLNNKVQADTEKWLNEGTKMGSIVNHGLDIKIALGFKF